jgi:hypothetical protein
VVSHPELGDGALGVSVAIVPTAPEDSEFAAFETKRMIFDFHVGAGNTQYDLPAGAFYFGGYYSSVGPPIVPLVTVSP